MVLAAANQFFSDKPTQLKLFGFVSKYLETLGSVTLKVTKSQISFAKKRQFAWVWLPQPWDRRRPKSCIVLSFSLDEPVRSPQIAQVVEPYPKRFMHHVIIERKADFNGDVKKWLKQAYETANDE